MSSFHEHNQNSSSADNFGTPEGYFARSARSIQQKLEWQDEHASFPHLLALQRNSGFTVPDHFFESREVQLELVTYPVLGGLKKVNPFTSPVQYFETSAEHLASVVSTTEPVLPILHAIEKTPVFVTPDQYFENNTTRLQTLLEDHKGGIVLQLFRSRIAFAAAAVLVIALGLWLFNTQSATSLTEDCGSMACLDKSDLIKTNNLENLEDEDLYELINSNELENTLNKPDKSTTPVNDSSVQRPETDIDVLLDEI